MPSCTSSLSANTTELWYVRIFFFLPLDELNRLEGFVHIADGQVKTEVEHGITRGFLTVLQAHKVSESPPGHHMGELGS